MQDSADRQLTQPQAHAHSRQYRDRATRYSSRPQDLRRDAFRGRQERLRLARHQRAQPLPRRCQLQH